MSIDLTNWAFQDMTESEVDADGLGGLYDGGAKKMEAIPDGKYNLVIEKAEQMANKKGTGSYLRVQFRVTDTQYIGHRLWGYYTIHNDSAWAEKMGRKAIFQIYKACGVDIKIPPSVLINKRLKATVYTEHPKDPQYKNCNRAKNFERADSHGLYD